MMKKLLQDKLVLLEWIIIITAIVFFYFGWFMPGMIIGGDFQYRPPEYFNDLCDYNTWQTNLSGGDYTIYNAQLTKYPVFLVSCALGSVDYPLMERLIWLFPYLIIAITGMYFFIKKEWPEKRLARVFGTIFFLINPTILERLYRGHVWMPFVYALTPWVLYHVLQAIRKKRLKHIIYAAVLLSIGIWFEVRTALLLIAMMVLFALVYLIYHFTKETIIFYGKAFFAGVGITFLLNLFWILPTLLYPPSQYYDETITSVPALMGSGKYTGTLLQAWHLSPLSWNEIYFPGSILLIVTFLSIFLLPWKQKDKWWISFLGLSVLIFVFLGKGTFPPFDNLFIWLELHIPFFIGYRVSSKFLLFAAFSLSIVFGLFLDRIYHSTWGKHFKSIYWKISLVFIALLLLCGNSFFMIRGYSEHFGNELGPEYKEKYKNEQNMFWPTKLETYYEDLWNFIKTNNDNDRRVIWYPKVNRYRLASNEHPQISSSSAFYYQEPLIDNILGQKGLLMNPSFHRLDIFLNLLHSKYIVVRPADESDWNYSKSQPYYKVIAALNNQYNVKPVFLGDHLPYKIANLNALNIATNGDYSFVDDNFLPGQILLEYISPFDQTFIKMTDFPEVSLEHYGFISFWIKSTISETISIEITDTEGRKFATYKKLNGNLEWQNVTLPLDSSLQNIASIKLYQILDGNRLVFSPFMLEPAGLRMYQMKTFSQDMLSLETKTIDDFSSKAAWQTKGELDIIEENIGFGTIPVIEYYSSDFNTFLARNFPQPQDIEDFDTLFFWLQAKRTENIEILIRDSHDNIQKKEIKTKGDYEWEPVFIGLDPIIRDIKVLQLKDIITTNELKVSPFTLAKTNIVPYEHNKVLPEMYFSTFNIHVPDQKLFSCFQLQYKNIPVNYAILSSEIPDGLPYNEVNSCLSWYYLEQLKGDQVVDFIIEDSHTVSYNIRINSNITEDTVFVFNQSHSPYWKLKADGVLITEHFPVNGYANAWLVPSGTTMMSIEFAPERVFRIALWILFFTIVVLSSTQIVRVIRSHNK